jgi:hypothetical protein
VRLLGLGGREIVRINRSGEVVPPHEMQDKSVRPFFWRTVKLPPGGVYLSAFDLNVVEGVIEQPYPPTLRMALPSWELTVARTASTSSITGARP